MATDTSSWLAQPEIPDEVRGVLGEFVPRVRSVLGTQMLGCWLWGSAALGGYVPGCSDVDVLVGLHDDPDEGTLALLAPVHDALVHGNPEWHNRVEVAYVGAPSLTTFRSRPHAIVRTSPGEALNLRTADHEWILDWYQVRAGGITLSGPPASDVIPAIEASELQRYARTALLGVEHLRLNGSDHRFRAYTVLRIARALHTARTGGQLSKQGAARRLAEAHPEWAPLASAAIDVHEGRPGSLLRGEVQRLATWAASRAQGTTAR